MEAKQIRNLSKGEWFTLKPVEEPNAGQVYSRGDYDRAEKKYECGKFADISYSRYFPGSKVVYVGFTF